MHSRLVSYVGDHFGLIWHICRGMVAWWYSSLLFLVELFFIVDILRREMVSVFVSDF